MLVNLSIGYWEGRKQDHKVNGEVTSYKHADRDAGLWTTLLVPPAKVKPALLARAAARAIHLKFTLPWQDEGVRILPAAMFLEYTRAMRGAKDDFNEAVENFVDQYADICHDARARLGLLYNEKDFPTSSEVRAKFSFEMRFVPVPTAGDFRVDLGAEATTEIRKGIEADAKASMATAMNDLWQRLYEQVEKMAERLGDADAVFRDSLISNIAGLCDLLPKMNFAGDRHLEQMRQEVIAKLAKKEPEVLRTNDTARADAAKAANDILTKMSGFMNRRAR